MDASEDKTAADATLQTVASMSTKGEADVAGPLLRLDAISDAGSCARGLIRDARCGRSSNQGSPHRHVHWAGDAHTGGVGT